MSYFQSKRFFSLYFPGHDRKVLIVASQSLQQITLSTNEYIWSLLGCYPEFNGCTVEDLKPKGGWNKKRAQYREDPSFGKMDL
jgi:hypothetical protein